MSDTETFNKEVQLSEEDMQSVLDCRKITLRNAVRGLSMSKGSDGITTDESDIKESNGQFFCNGMLLEQPFGVGDVLKLKSRTANVLVKVISVHTERLQDMDGLKAYNEGIEVEIPPACKGVTFPKDMDTWSESAREEWFKKTARARYIANIELDNRFLRKFSNQWNKSLSAEDFDKYCWNSNPYVFVTEFRMLSDICSCERSMDMLKCATL